MRQNDGEQRVPDLIRSDGQKDTAGREAGLRVVISVQGQTDLLQIVAALCATRSLASLLNGGCQQSHKHCCDRNDDQQFNQGETPVIAFVQVGRHGIDGKGLRQFQIDRRYDVVGVTDFKTEP